MILDDLHGACLKYIEDTGFVPLIKLNLDAEIEILKNAESAVINEMVNEEKIYGIPYITVFGQEENFLLKDQLIEGNDNDKS